MIPIPALASVATMFGKVPRWLWYVIGAALIVLAFVIWHRGQVKDHRKQVEAEFAEKINKQSQRLIAAAVKLRQKAEQLQTATNKQVEDNYEVVARNIGSRADALRLRKPPQCPTPSGQRGVSAVSRPAGEPQAAPAGGANAGLAAIPWGPLISYGEEYDRRGAHIDGLLDWHEAQKKIYEDWLSSSQ